MKKKNTTTLAATLPTIQIYKIRDRPFACPELIKIPIENNSNSINYLSSYSFTRISSYHYLSDWNYYSVLLQGRDNT